MDNSQLGDRMKFYERNIDFSEMMCYTYLKVFM
jgi:hypothetical protein